MTPMDVAGETAPRKKLGRPRKCVTPANGAALLSSSAGEFGPRKSSSLPAEVLASGVDRLAWLELRVEDGAYGQSYAQCASRTA
jgi:hypothetical protein